ncbi:group III truncated hemoglobin [Parapedobacter koreensis]|uniref:Hemoglobin n=1 Tax=Parapedobacter koreensis TaxID=332977 RepID=A0A1H7HXB6_9SPHI|nr:group III truncated hemoglobin [Parapedobacter koreensis]SEK54993.1 hemoglobin [Parapedobacter koreensis]
METKSDIETIADIQLLVDTFYGNVRLNPLIGPVFDSVIQGRWPEHLEKMYRFWQTVLLGEYTYQGAPFPPHASLPIGKAHFNAWLGLWRDTVDGLFTGEKAEEAKWRAEKMATMFLSKIEYYRSHPRRPLI